MSIIKAKHKKTNFTIIDNGILRDPRLTWSARGLACHLLSMEENWEIYVAHLVQQSPGGRDHVYTLLSELEKFGYARKMPRRMNNRFDGVDWTIYESPLLPRPDFPDTDGPDTGHPDTENPPLRSTNTKKIKNKKNTSLSEVPSCPHQAIVDLYHEILPMLPKVVFARWPGTSRAKNLSTRWKEETAHQTLEFWRQFFEVVKTNPWWTSKDDGNWGGANLEWLVERRGFDKVIERWANSK